MMSKTGQKSLKLNMILNAFRGCLSVLFPLITFPYASKVLGVDNLGKYNFSNSLISYFILFAGLGINTYAIREGARIREKKRELELFCSEMLSINLCSTVVSYVLLFIMLAVVPKFQDYKMLIIVFSLQIIFKTIGVEWLYSIYEDYLYITIRSIFFQLISIIALFIFVKEQDDIDKYALITALSASGSDLLNYIHGRKYCRFKMIRKIDWKKHIKPIMILFAMTATVVIYVSSDIIILGFLCGDYTVGIYSVSVKVYTILKTLLSSMLIVSIPRLSALLGQNKKEEFLSTSMDIYKTLISIALPAVIGIIVLRKEIVLMISEEAYLSATSSLMILSIALFFCLGAWFWGQCILVPIKKEIELFKITVFSAIVNILLNFVFIPLWKENAAALTTVIAEGLTFFWSWKKGNDCVKTPSNFSTFIKVIIGCMGIIFYSFLIRLIVSNLFMLIITTILGSILVYGLIEIVLGNESINSIVKSIKNKIKKA